MVLFGGRQHVAGMFSGSSRTRATRRNNLEADSSRKNHYLQPKMVYIRAIGHAQYVERDVTSVATVCCCTTVSRSLKLEEVEHVRLRQLRER